MASEKKEKIKNKIVLHVEKNSQLKLTDIQRWAEINFDVSESTTKNYLEELVKEERLRTWYDNNRFYTLPVKTERIRNIIKHKIKRDYLLDEPPTAEEIEKTLEEKNIYGEDILGILVSMRHDGEIRTVRNEDGNIRYTPAKWPTSVKWLAVALSVISIVTITGGITDKIDIGTMFPASILTLGATTLVWYLKEKNILRW